MHLILLSGGSGKRLWPLTNGTRSKQFLELLPAEGGGTESMARRICRQIKESAARRPWDSVTVVAGAAQRDQLLMHLDAGIEILTEPDRRDTFPAIAFACAWLRAEKGVRPGETVAAMPVDAFVGSDFFDCVGSIEDELAGRHADIVLIGSKPSRPSENYGYILRDAPADGGAQAKSRPVSGFKEKPSAADAEGLIAKGALWNCGVFGMRLGYVLDILQSRFSITDFGEAAMRSAFFSLPKSSFDYVVVEGAENVRVIEYAGAWKDLGTWDTLAEEMGARAIGHVVADDADARSRLINELNVPLVALGAKGMVVVASPDGILVADKTETHRLKDALKAVDARPMYEKKIWGEYVVLDITRTENGDILTKKMTLRGGGQISYQVHEHRKEIWTITHGTGVLYIDGEKREIREGETVAIPVGARHGLHALTDLELIEIQFGRPLIEEDIVRLERDWDSECAPR
jgi:mannose-1-phosphate guanylyltransferase